MTGTDMLSDISRVLGPLVDEISKINFHISNIVTNISKETRAYQMRFITNHRYPHLSQNLLEDRFE